MLILLLHSQHLAISKKSSCTALQQSVLLSCRPRTIVAEQFLLYGSSTFSRTRKTWSYQSSVACLKGNSWGLSAGFCVPLPLGVKWLYSVVRSTPVVVAQKCLLLKNQNACIDGMQCCIGSKWGCCKTPNGQTPNSYVMWDGLLHSTQSTSIFSPLFDLRFNAYDWLIWLLNQREVKCAPYSPVKATGKHCDWIQEWRRPSISSSWRC